MAPCAGSTYLAMIMAVVIVVSVLSTYLVAIHLSPHGLRSLSKKGSTAGSAITEDCGGSLSSRRAGINRWLDSLSPKEPRGKEAADAMATRVEDVAISLPPAAPSAKRVGVEFGEGTGWLVYSTAQLAGAKSVKYSMHQAKPEDKACSVAGTYDICWCDNGPSCSYHKEDPSIFAKKILSPIRLLYTVLGQKSALLKNLERAQSKYGSGFAGVMPESFHFPEQKQLILKQFEKDPSTTWIIKPTGGFAARGIYLMSPEHPPPKAENLDGNGLPKEGPFVVQRYINPLLLKGFKFDMRLHVLVRLQPLRIYFNQNAIVRLASEKFEPGTATFRDKCMHITNQAYQGPKCENYIPNVDVSNPQSGHLWNLDALTDYMERVAIYEPVNSKPGISKCKKTKGCNCKWASDKACNPSYNDGSPCWSECCCPFEPEITSLKGKGSVSVSTSASKRRLFSAEKDNAKTRKENLNRQKFIASLYNVILKSVLAGFDTWDKPKIKESSRESIPVINEFNIIGPDVTVDNLGQPWLLEINAFPTTMVSSPLGTQLKLRMLTDTWSILGAAGYDRTAYKATVEAKLEKFCNSEKRKSCTAAERRVIWTFEDESYILDLDSHVSFDRIYPRPNDELTDAELLKKVDYLNTPANKVMREWVNFRSYKSYK